MRDNAPSVNRQLFNYEEEEESRERDEEEGGGEEGEREDWR